MKTFATLGGVKFELEVPESISETTSWEYKEQETVAEKAVIQFAGAKARTMDIKGKLLAAFCKPEERVKELKAKAKKIAPLPLILANGNLVGYFVINDISTTILKTDTKANVLAMELSLKLTETDADASGGAGAGGAATGGALGNPNIKKPITPAGIQAPDPLAAIRQTMAEKQQQVTGSIPSIDAVLRRAVGG